MFADLLLSKKHKAGEGGRAALQEEACKLQTEKDKFQAVSAVLDNEIHQHKLEMARRKMELENSRGSLLSA